MADAWNATLPEEILVAISRRLERHCEGEYPRCSQGDLAAARLACKRWSVAVPSAVKSLDVEGEFPDGPLSRNLSSLESLTWKRGVSSPRFAAATAKNLRVLKLRYSVPSGSLGQLAAECPCLESLELNHVPLTHRGGYDLSPLGALTALKSLGLVLHNSLGRPPFRKTIAGLERLTTITSLTLQENHMTDIPPAVCLLTRLESLAIRDCRQVTSLKALEKLPRLTSLDLVGCYRAELATIPSTVRSLDLTRGEVVMADVYSAVGASLTYLDITDSMVDDEGSLRQLGLMTSLETLVARNVMGFSRSDLNALGSLQRLRTLDLSGCQCYYPSDTISDISGLGSISSLTSLTIEPSFVAWTFPSDVEVLARLQGLTCLRMRGLAPEREAALREALSDPRALIV